MSEVENSFQAIHPQIMRIDSHLTFDVYLKTKDGYSRLISKGKTYSALIHVKIFKYSISTLYIKIDQLDDYYFYLEENFSLVFMDMLISVKSKARIGHEMLTQQAKKILDHPTEESIELYKHSTSIMTKFIFQSKDAIKYLIPLSSSSFHEYNHLVNVGIYGLGLLKEIIGNSDKFNITEIGAGFFLHDIGKSEIPKHVIQKTGKLSPEEWNAIKLHPERGYEILDEFGFITDEVEVIVLQHHERNNGTGYPKKLRGDQIHMFSKICAIADIFDALTSHRPYRYAQSSFKALKIMQTEMKQDFDPKFFARFVLMFSKSNIGKE